MLVKLFHLGQSLLTGTDFSAVIADILFILVLIELYRLLIIYLDEHRISVSTMVEVGIVSTLREVILKGALQIDWRQMLVLCAFVLTLTLVLRYAGLRPARRRSNRFVRPYQAITTSGLPDVVTLKESFDG
jgi:uncharacterized membrane protein (DUF373 family)